MPDGAAANLPSWDLSDLYSAPDSPALLRDLDRTEADAIAFAARYAGKLAGLSGAGLAAAIGELEAIEEVMGRVMSYAQLLFAADSIDAGCGKFYQSMQERVTVISAHLIFFSLELNRMDDATLAAKRGPAMARWQSFLRDLRVFRPHQLSDELEKLLHEKEVTGRSAWSRLFDETIVGLRVPMGDEELTVSAVLNKLSDTDRATRAAAGAAIGDIFGKNEKLFALITNTLAKDKEIIDTWRHYPTPASARNRANMVEDEVVAALVEAVVGDFPRLSHRYYTMKAKWLGLAKLQHWDRNAPLPGDDDREIPWPEAQKRVLDAYGAFSPELAEVGKQFFDQPWIDVPPRPGKSGGAFAHPTVPSAHPYLLLNYHGTTRDLVPERIGEIWMQVQTESLGPAFEFTPDYHVFWAYVPHFIHSPFYVYAYAFGDCLVNALYAVYQSGHPGFAEKYLAMLRAGGTMRHQELLAPFGLDASDPNFWRRGLDIISGFIDELEMLPA
jgi:oligoendopeptidase F